MHKTIFGKIGRAAIAGAALAAVMVPATGAALAQTTEPASKLSTRELLGICSEAPAESGRSAAFCEGFIVGTGLLYLELVRAETIKPWACADPAPSVDQIRRDFVAWAGRNSDHLDDPAIDGFWRAMAETYPCRAQ